MWAYQESWIYRHREIVPFFKVLEGEQQLSTMILDYSISQTTLEEVFLKVSHCMWPTVASCICVEWELKTPCMLYIMTLNGPIPGHLRGLGMRPLVWNKSTSMGMKHKYMTPTLCQESLPVNIIFFRLHWMNCSRTRLTSRFWCALGPTLPPPPWVPWVQWQVPPRRQQTLALSENNNYSNLVNKLVLILYYLLLCSTQMLASLCFERILMFGLGPYPYIPWVGCWESRPIYILHTRRSMLMKKFGYRDAGSQEI